MDPLNTFDVAEEDISGEDVRLLLARHFDLMRSNSPISSCHVMQPDELLDAQAVLLTVRRAGDLLGLGAIRQIAPAHAELKSMHTSQKARGQGVGQIVLTHLLARARCDGMSRVSLETGTIDLFAPARALYVRNGFVECPPFGDYVHDPLSVFMTRLL